MFKKITEKIEDWICAGLPRPISEEQHREDEKRIVQSIIYPHFITQEDIDKIREENMNYDFLEGLDREVKFCKEKL